MTSEIVYQVVATVGLIIASGASVAFLRLLSRQSRQKAEFLNQQTALEQEKQAVEVRLAQSEDSQSSLNEKNFQLKDKLGRLEQEFNQLQHQAKTLQETKITLESDLKESQEKGTKLQRQFTELAQAKAEVAATLEQETAKISALQLQVADLTQAKEESIAKLQQEIAKLATLRVQVVRLEKENQQLQEQLQQLATLEVQIKDLTVAKEEAEVNLQQATATTNSLTAEVAGLQEQLQQLATLEAQIKDLTVAKEEAEVNLQAIEKVATSEEQTTELETQQLQLEEQEQEQQQQQQPVGRTKAKAKEKKIIELPQQLITSVEPLVIESAPDREKFSGIVTEAEIKVREVTETPLAESIEVIAPLPEGATPPAPTTKEEEKKHSLAGKTLAVVGTLTKLNREQAKQLIQKAGGQVTSSPGTKTDYVVVGKAPGDKLKKAQKLGIPQLSETQFLKLLESSGISV